MTDDAAGVTSSLEELRRWGRVDPDGTVHVRDGHGERVIGSWHAGTPDEGLAFYGRKFDDLEAEVRLLEARVTNPGIDVRSMTATTRKLRESLPQAAVIGDLAALNVRLDAVSAALDARWSEMAEQRAAAAAEAVAKKQAVVDEARQLAVTTSWRAGSERYRELVEQWKAIRGVDRATDSKLWEEFSSARREFDRNRRAAAVAAESQRAVATERKEGLIRQAEKLAGSTEWSDTARRFRDLMTEWKAAGRAGRDADEALWVRFKAAQDAFFTARSAAFAARDGEQQEHLEAKAALVAEAEAIDVTNVDAARKQLRRIQDRWDAVGRVPRHAMAELDRRLGVVEDRLRDAANSDRPIVKSESPLVIRLRESVTKLERRLQRATTAGDAALAAETETALTTQRAWLAQAEGARSS